MWKRWFGRRANAFSFWAVMACIGLALALAAWLFQPSEELGGTFPSAALRTSLEEKGSPNSQTPFQGP